MWKIMNVYFSQIVLNKNMALSFYTNLFAISVKKATTAKFKL